MKIAEAKKYKWDKVVNDLGGLPRQKVHCSVMAVQGLQKAINDYEERQKNETDKKVKKVVIKKVKSAAKIKTAKTVKKSPTKAVVKKKGK
jgi:hypothetical protein